MADSLALIRSGATDYDLQGRIRGTLDIPLSGEGMAEAHRAAAALSTAAPAALYTSPSACAIETSRICGRAVGLRARRITELGNLDQGLWQGMLVEDIRRRQPRLHRQWHDNPWAVSPPEGELLESACSRVEAALETILRRHPGERVALVVPTPLDRIVLWLLTGESMGSLWTREARAEPVVIVPLDAQWSPVGRNDSPRAAGPTDRVDRGRPGRLQKLRT